MNPILYCLILAILGGVGMLAMRLRNSRFQSGAKALEMEEKTASV